MVFFIAFSVMPYALTLEHEGQAERCQLTANVAAEGSDIVNTGGPI